MYEKSISLVPFNLNSAGILSLFALFSALSISDNNVDYVAELSSSGVTNIEKAIFGDATRFSRNKQEKRKATKPTENLINLSDDAE